MPITDYQKQFEAKYRILMEDGNISKTNKAYFVDFVAQLDANNSRPATKSMYCNHVRTFLAKCPEDVKVLFDDKNAVNRLFSELKNQTHTKNGKTKTISETTYNTVIKKSKTFVKWLNDDELPKSFKTLKVKECRRELSYSDILTDEEIVKLIDCADDIQTKALISIACDAALRPSELYDIRIGDISKGSILYKLEVRKHKTKARNAHLSHSIPEVTAWLNVHPLKDDLSAPLWISRLGGNVRKPNYRSLMKRVQTVFRRAKINKPCDFYILRHNANSRKKRDGVDPVVAAKQSGHSLKMYTETYGRFAPEDEERSIARTMRMGKSEEIKLKTPVKCSCGNVNRAESDYCTGCGEPLSVAAIQKREHDHEKMLRKQMEEIITSEMMKEFKSSRK